MDDKLNIGLIQDKYTNFIIYDESQKCNGDNWILTEEINSLTIIFNGLYVEHSKIYKFDETKKAQVIGYESFNSWDFSDYLKSRTLKLNVNGIDVSVIITKNISNANDLVTELNLLISPITNEIVITNNGNVIEAHNTVPGSESYIYVKECDILDVIKWNEGIYKGNDFKWHTTGILQKDFNFKIDYDDMNYEKELPQTYWDIQITIGYTKNNIDKILTNTYTEFSYKQTEIYRAKLFEYIANNFEKFNEVEQRLQTDFELLMQKSIYFDSLYKSFIASIEVGNKDRSLKLLEYLTDYEILNPIV